MLVNRFFGIINKMSPELQQYYDNRFDLFIHPGWKELIEDLEGMLKQYEDIRNCDKDTIEFRKGQIDILDYLIGLRELSQRTYEELKNGEKDI